MARLRLVGRETEQASLAGWLAEAGEGSPRVVLCTGEPGIGKTRLAEEVSDTARGQGHLVAWGLADETAGTPPYWVWRQVLRVVSADVDFAKLSALPHDGAARFRLFEAVADTLRALVVDRTVLVVLDDMHWADEASLLMLRHVVRGLRDERLLLLVNCRELVGRPGEVLLDLCRAPTARTLALSGLSAAHVRDALRDATAEAIDDAAAAATREMTGGNPLFVLELADAMRRGRVDPRRPPLTPTVREAISARLANRSAECRAFLHAATVLGQYFQPEIAGGIGRLTRAEQATALAEAAGAGLVEPHADQYRFVHALTREAILAGVAPVERTQLHRRAAEVMISAGTSRTGRAALSIAQHLLEASPAESTDAALWCERAGDTAMRELAYEDAARWYRSALRAGGRQLDIADCCRLLLAIGTAANRSGDLSGRLTACVEAAELARAARLPDVLADAALTMEPTGQLGFDLTIRRLCEEARAALPESARTLRARLTARFAATYIYLPDPQAARAASAEALEQATESGDPAAIAEACRARLAIAAGPADLAERAALAARLQQIGEERADARVALAAQLAHIDTAFERGDLPAVAVHLDQAARAAELVGGLVARFSVLHSRAALAQACGRFREARDAIAEAFAVMAAGEIAARFHTRAAVLGMIGRHAGQDEESLGAAGYRDAPAGIKDGPGVIVPVAYAAALVSAGRLAEAREAYQSVGPPDRWRIPPHVALLVPALGIATAAALGETADLTKFARDLTPFADHHVVSGIGAITYGGPVELWLGVAARHVGHRDRAVLHLRNAEACCARIGAHGYRVEAATELAEVLSAGGSAAEANQAREIAAQATRAAGRLGMAPYIDRLARLVGSTPPAETLTPRQREVAELVADGLTNREIAERLVLSERTAENHVQHIMIKLGVPNRSAIAVWVTQRRLSTPAE